MKSQFEVCGAPARTNFFASGVFELKAKLGPILWQLPPVMRFNPERIERFLSMLPHDTAQALELAGRHDARMEGRKTLRIDRNRRLRHALEVRHESFVTERFIDLLREQNVALVVADTAGRWPFLEDLTSDFVYVRLHGDVKLYESGYTDAALERWAARVRAWLEGRAPGEAKLAARPPSRTRRRDVYVYFDNDIKVHAPYDAMNLAAKVAARKTKPHETKERRLKTQAQALPR